VSNIRGLSLSVVAVVKTRALGIADGLFNQMETAFVGVENVPRLMENI
jgi:hypothetical protein